MAAERWIGRVAVAVSVGCVGALAATGVSLAWPGSLGRLGFATSAPASFSVGRSSGLVSSLFAGHQYTVVFFASADCAASRRAQPAIRAIASAIGSREDYQVSVVMNVAGARDKLKAQGFVAGLGVKSAYLSDVDLLSTPVKTVPALLVVDRTGRVLATWDRPFDGNVPNYIVSSFHLAQ